MNLQQLQEYLLQTGRYKGKPEGYWTQSTRDGIMTMLADGADTPLTDADMVEMARRNSLKPDQVKAVATVEAAGAGFQNGLPKILPEPHIFSKLTNHKWDIGYPSVSYPKWGTRPYPATQGDRYNLLLQMINLDCDAGFSSASYGKFQILGSNFKLCGFSSAPMFAEAMGRDEKTQLLAFEKFLLSTNLMEKLKACTSDPKTCEAFCAGYNGSAFRENKYHEKLAAAIRRFSTPVSQ